MWSQTTVRTAVLTVGLGGVEDLDGAAISTLLARTGHIDLIANHYDAVRPSAA